MNESEERQRKRREYERGQEELQLIAQEKKRALKISELLVFKK